jgi:hypothetical protein
VNFNFSLIPNASNWYKMYVVWVAAAIAVLNVVQVNSDAIQALIPPAKLPYYNLGLAIFAGLVRQIHQPVIQPTPSAPPVLPSSPARMVVHTKEK